MAFDRLFDFLSALEDEGQLVRISATVEPALEITEITNRISRQTEAGPALFFESVRGSSIPIVTNVLGNPRRLCRALGTASFEEAADRIAALLQPDLPQDWFESLKLVPQFAKLTKIPPKTVETAECQQVVNVGRDVNLLELPFPSLWPQDSSPVMTSGLCITKDPESGVRNVANFPIQVLERDRLTIHWNCHDEAYRHWSRHVDQESQMPVAIVLGGDPSLTFAAHAGLPPRTDPCLLAGFFRGDNVELVRCRSIELEVPAHAEIVIEGYIECPAPLQTAASVSLPSGFASGPIELPTMTVTAMTHRANPILPVAVWGPPPNEQDCIGRSLERIFQPLLRLLHPDIVDIHMPTAGIYRNLLFVSLRKNYPGQARQIMHALWGNDRFSHTKLIVVVDEDVNVEDEQSVWFHVGANTHPGRDVTFCEGPTHMQDHAAPVPGIGHKMGIDATRKLPDEGHTRAWPQELTMTDQIRGLVNDRWSEYELTEFLNQWGRS